ncbi:MAG: 30S ribosome-binding factor RbfA [Rhodospirillales bacterium]|tara:strand:- start:5360 stop:5737 length:378 start_codon:yes stop_codon:yes gene_type:complete
MGKKSKHMSRHVPSQRQLRVGEELRHLLSQIFDRGELNHPDLVNVTITVSEVRVSPDLNNATIFITRLGGGERKVLIEAAQSASPFIRRQLAKRVYLRRVPKLKFEADTSFDYAMHIDHLLGSID